MEEQSQGQNLSEGVSAKDVLNTAQETGTIVPESTEEGTKELQQEQQEIETQEAETQEEVKPEKSEDDLFSSKFAALSRKEKALKKRERDIEARIAELEQRLADNQTPEVEEEPFELKLKKNPLDALAEKGLSYDILTQIALNDGKLTPELQMQLLRDEMSSSLHSKIEALESKLAEKEEKEAQSKHEQTISGFKNQIKQHISSDAENLELLAIQDDNQGIDLVYDVISEHYNEYEEVLDIKTAAELVENHLLEEAKKYIGRNKIKKLMGASEEKTQESKPIDKKSSMTLSNDQSQTSSTGRREMSEEEQLREAAKLIRWEE